MLRFVLRIISALSLTFVCETAHAELTAEKIPAVASFKIQLTDDVTDRCWTNSESTVSAVELIFRQSNIPISSQGKLLLVGISSIGFELSETFCAVSWNFNVYTYYPTQDFGMVRISVFRRSGLLSNRKPMNSVLLSKFEESAKEFANEYLRLHPR